MRHFRLSEDDVARFWSRVNKSGPVPEYRPDLGPCWLWLGTLEPDGYARFYFGGGECPGHNQRIHRVSHFLAVGVVLETVDEVDHLCRVRHCCNPTHLERVTKRENIRRSSVGEPNLLKTHCPRGHAFDAANTRIYYSRGYRSRACRACGIERLRQGRERDKLAQEAQS